MRSSIIIVAFLLATCAGCKKEPVTPPRAAPEAPEPSAASGPSFAIEAVTLGAEPRHELQRSIESGFEQKINLRVDSQVDAILKILSLKQPPRGVTLELSVRAEERGRSGGHAFTFVIDKIGADHAAETPPESRGRLDGAAAQMRGLRGSYLIDSRGTLRDVTIPIPPDAPPEVWSITADIEWALQRLAVTFPGEALGIGARWRVNRVIKQDGVDAREVSTIEITELKHRLVTVHAEFGQDAEPQAFRNPGSKVNVELIELTGEGEGKITWDLSQPLPHSARITSAVSKHIRYEVKGKPLSPNMVTHRTLTIPARRP